MESMLLMWKNMSSWSYVTCEWPLTLLIGISLLLGCNVLLHYVERHVTSSLAIFIVEYFQYWSVIYHSYSGNCSGSAYIARISSGPGTFYLLHRSSWWTFKSTWNPLKSIHFSYPALSNQSMWYPSWGILCWCISAIFTGFPFLEEKSLKPQDKRVQLKGQSRRSFQTSTTIWRKTIQPSCRNGGGWTSGQIDGLNTTYIPKFCLNRAGTNKIICLPLLVCQMSLKHFTSSKFSLSHFMMPTCLSVTMLSMMN